MLERAKGLVKKVTLEAVYEVVDERTKEILEVVKEIEKRQNEDFRYLNQKIDTQIGQVRSEMGQLRQEITQMREEFKAEIHRLDEKIDRMNQRIDTVIQMLSEIMRSK